MARRALVVGGTGPTGPGTVDGLLGRGFDVTILHSGLHEIDLGPDVEHIHTDPHSEAALQSALQGRTFDVGIAMYGRLRLVADALAGRVGQVVAVGGVFYDGWINDQFHTTVEGDVAEVPMPPYTYPPVPMPENAPMDANPNNRFAQRALATERHVMELHAAGRFSATMLRFPKVYGPRAIAALEWSVVRRVLDGRTAMLVPDGGLLQETKLYAGTASAAVLAAVDRPEQAAGETFNVGDRRPTTTREWITLLAHAVGAELELVSIPFAAAAPTFPYARDPWTICHHVLDVSKLATRLDWTPPLSVQDALALTARHLAEHPLTAGGEEEIQIGDRFDYGLEDEYFRAVAEFTGRLAGLGSSEFRYRHPYRHPKAVG